MMDVTQDIRDIAQDITTSLESALLKCLVLADKTGVQPLFDWATAELEGYDQTRVCLTNRLTIDIVRIGGA